MTPPPDTQPLLSLCRVCKAYGQPVLEDVHLEVLPGQVHALVGENGAGKSTLSRIVAGLTAPDEGEMRFLGRLHTPRSKQEGERAGIRLVMQELNLIPTLTVAESLCLDDLPSRWGWINQQRLRDRAREVLHSFGLDSLDPDGLVGDLGVGQQQLVEIALGLSRRCDLLILDEPTAALTAPEVEILFTQVRKLQARGSAVLYISHRLEEINEIADWITVLRDGRVAASSPMEGISQDQIIRWMVGRDIEVLPRRAEPHRQGVGLRVSGLCRGTAVSHVSLEVRPGEILGLAGLMGSGRTETVRAIFGADVREGGDVFVGDTLIPPGSPKAAVDAGLALLTEDRKGQGLFLPLSVSDNITLSRLGALGGPLGWIDRAAERREAEAWLDRLSIRCASPGQPVRELSGGNQQKAIVARWLARDAHVLVFDEPTRGVDVGARQEIHSTLSALAEDGKAILVVSSDLKELFALCDRIAVMSAGRVAGVFERGAWTENGIMAAALSGCRGNRVA